MDVFKNSIKGATILVENFVWETYGEAEAYAVKKYGEDFTTCMHISSVIIRESFDEEIAKNSTNKIDLAVENNLELHKIISFDEVVEHGIKNGANVVNGLPWSWKINGKSVTHENDKCYIIETIDGVKHFHTGESIIAYESGLKILINHGY